MLDGDGGFVSFPLKYAKFNVIKGIAFISSFGFESISNIHNLILN